MVFDTSHWRAVILFFFHVGLAIVTRYQLIQSATPFCESRTMDEFYRFYKVLPTIRSQRTSPLGWVYDKKLHTKPKQIDYVSGEWISSWPHLWHFKSPQSFHLFWEIRWNVRAVLRYTLIPVLFRAKKSSGKKNAPLKDVWKIDLNFKDQLPSKTANHGAFGGWNLMRGILQTRYDPSGFGDLW